MKRPTEWFWIVVIAILPQAPVSGQWQFTNLQLNQFQIGAALYGVDGDQKTGFSRPEALEPSERAMLWVGPDNQPRSLHPSGMRRSVLTGVEGNAQVGWSTTTTGAYRAGLWHGTAASWINLSPNAAGWAMAIGDGQQGGYIFVGLRNNACVWTGSAESMVNIHPVGYSDSFVYGVDNGQQAGVVGLSPNRLAALWTGTAASFVNLNPAGSAESWAVSAFEGQQGGSFRLPGGQTHAALWSGSAESVIDLHPAGASESTVTGLHSGLQVGSARVGGVQRASLWSGSSQTWLDLSSFLPSGFGDSSAYSVWTDGERITVVGRAYNLSLERFDPVMWTVPGPGSATALLLFGAIARARRR